MAHAVAALRESFHHGFGGMRAVALTTAVVAVALGAAGSADGASERDALIRPGVGIGKVRLGMTLVQVQRALGQQFVVNRRVRRGFGVTYAELGWDYGWWRVGFLVRRGRYRVVLVGTVERREHTRAGVGVGTSESTLQRRMRVSCNRNVRRPYREPTLTWYRYCTAGPTGGRQTIFLIRCTASGLYSCPSYVVGEVVIREPF
jgi:hypothetical protein